MPLSGDLGPAGTGFLTVALIAPWMVSTARAAARGDGDLPAGVQRPGPTGASLRT